MSMERHNANALKEELTGRVKSYLSGFLRAVLVGLLVLLQFFLIVISPFILRNFTVYFYVVLELLSFIVILNLVNDNRSPTYKVSWISIVLMLPISGHIMYALWGKSNSKKKIEEKVEKKMSHGQAYLEFDDTIEREYALMHPVKARLSRYMSNQGFPLFRNNHITYFPMGEDAFQSIFEELEKAERFILIDFFIVAEGAIWDKIYEILLRKIRAGVEVKFMYDDFGAMLRTKKNFRKELEAEGFEIRVINPIHKYTDKLYMNYRSHQKIMVIDGNVGFTGGFNLADEYANIIERFGVWKDNGIKMVGDGVWGLTVLFLQMWEASSENDYLDFNKYRPTMKFEHSQVYCHVISDGPSNNPRNPIESIYKQMITSAREFIYIMTPYLIIEEDMKNILIEAVKGGVDVRIITPNIPDKKNVKLVTNYNYGALLENGIRIYEYTPGFIHAKTIINEGCGVVGTINMDYRSFYLHYENGVWMSNRKVIGEIKKDFDKTFEESHELSYEEWLRRPVNWKIIQPFLNLFSTLM